MERKVSFVLVWIVASFLIIESSIPKMMMMWWGANFVDTAYRGPSRIIATEWWALPALVEYFILPSVPFIVAGWIVFVFYDKSSKK